MITQLSGFSSPIHDAQITFRSLLNALANPGQIFSISPLLTSPSGMTTACAAACLTLIDRETLVWVQPDSDEQILAWLRFDAG
jgi:alpha-D-ribose 1-methylphosphonate 5-triphosphate synthase subunit PhnH